MYYVKIKVSKILYFDTRGQTGRLAHASVKMQHESVAEADGPRSRVSAAFLHEK